MYIPAAFDISDLWQLHGLMEQYSFATLVTVAEGRPFVSHLPLVLDRSEGRFGTLLGHVARANPHWQLLSGAAESLAIFHGPHAYISPAWYSGKFPAVPTWNYAVVHASGPLVAIQDRDWIQNLLQRMVTIHESPLTDPWADDLSDELRDTGRQRGWPGTAHH